MKFINTLVVFTSLFTYTCMGIEVIGTTGEESRYAETHDITIDVPAKTKDGDLLVLIAQVTEGILPEGEHLDVEPAGDWKDRASCFKKGNGSSCRSFGGHRDYRNAYDLGQAIYTKTANSNDNSFKFTFGRDLSKPGDRHSHKTWLTLVTLRGADTSNPIRAWKGKGNDGSSRNLFPSIYVHKEDMVLLSMTYDDGEDSDIKVTMSHFTAPSNFNRIAAYIYTDETSMVYAREWPSTGETGDMKTKGEGAHNNKDALISFAVKPSGGGVTPAPTDLECTGLKHVQTKCGSNGCRNRVQIDKYSPRTCDSYCKAQNGATCVGAWEDKANSCAVLDTASCSTDFKAEYDGTSDAICECNPSENKCTNFNFKNVLKRCGSKGCKNLVRISRYSPRTCNSYCNAHGARCVGAWEDKDNKCIVLDTASCSTDFRAKYGGTSDAICECE